jgi:hypothetical protein
MLKDTTFKTMQLGSFSSDKSETIHIVVLIKIADKYTRYTHSTYHHRMTFFC